MHVHFGLSVTGEDKVHSYTSKAAYLDSVHILLCKQSPSSTRTHKRTHIKNVSGSVCLFIHVISSARIYVQVYIHACECMHENLHSCIF